MFVTNVFSRSLAVQGPKNILHRKCPSRIDHSDSVYHNSTLGGVIRRLATTTTSLQYFNGGPPRGATGGSDNGHHLVDEETTMTGPWGMMLAGPAIGTTKV
jgi:hypothetical protein